ncbi:protein NKG7-like [Gopherus flavomarginatus]|uniref:protein NKG7-like n=1 Tax=Gopherus flavomarginatus TaxID=286002 RepID=UPI0021CC41AD|nr:protein NKG7-like [Gopherus flavomarginatus]
MPCLRIASPSLALLSLLLLLAALGSDHWLLTTENQMLIHSGLWKFCMNLRCLIPLTVPDRMRASRVCLILAVIAAFLSCLALLASFFRSHLGSVPLTLVSAVGSFSAGLCATIAMAVFTSQSAKSMMGSSARVSFGWAFGLGWAACPLALLASVVTFFSQGSSWS